MQTSGKQNTLNVIDIASIAGIVGVSRPCSTCRPCRRGRHDRLAHTSKVYARGACRTTSANLDASTSSAGSCPCGFTGKMWGKPSMLLPTNCRFPACLESVWYVLVFKRSIPRLSSSPLSHMYASSYSNRHTQKKSTPTRMRATTCST